MTLWRKTCDGWRGDYNHEKEKWSCIHTMTNPMATPTEKQFAQSKLYNLMQLEVDQMKQYLRESVKP